MKFNFFLNSIKSIRINIIFFLTISLVSYSQIENSNRKIELLPPASAALKKLDITPTNPNYFSLKKKDKSSTSKKIR